MEYPDNTVARVESFTVHHFPIGSGKDSCLRVVRLHAREESFFASKLPVQKGDESCLRVVRMLRVVRVHAGGRKLFYT